MTGHAVWEELAAGHALSSLEPEDEQAFVGHLRGCDLCGRSLAELRVLAGQLAYAVEPVEPPEALVRAIADGAHASGRALAPGWTPEPARRSRFSPPPTIRQRPVALAVLVVVLLAMSSLVVQLRADRRTALRQARQDREFAALLAEPTTRVVALTSPTGAYGRALLTEEEVWLAIDGLARSTAEVVYVLWTRSRAGAYTAVGRFDIVRDGTNVIARLPLDGSHGDLSGLLVSREPGRQIPPAPSEHVAEGSLPT